MLSIIANMAILGNTYKEMAQFEKVRTRSLAPLVKTRDFGMTSY